MLFRKPQAHKPGDRIAQADSTTTDDTGAYEFSNLAPGEYLLAVKAEPWYAIHPSQSRSPNDPAAALDVAYPITYFDSTYDETQASSIFSAEATAKKPTSTCTRFQPSISPFKRPFPTTAPAHPPRPRCAKASSVRTTSLKPPLRP